MFSEYASRFLTKPQTAPLFQGSTGALDSDTEAFLGWVDNSASSSEEDLPPDEIAIERPVGPSDSLNPFGASETENTSSTSHLRSNIRITPGRSRGNNNGTSHLEGIVALLYLVLISMTLTMGTLVSFSTSPSPIGIYPIFGRSFRTLLVICVLSIAAALGWLWAMRSNPRGMVQLNTFVVPVICTLTFLYGFFGSFHASTGHGLVHTAMRTVSLVPLLAAVGWVYILRRDKNSVGRASEMISLALKVFDGSPLLLGVSITCSIAATVLTYLWILFVSRAFLEGSLSILFALLFSFAYFWTSVLFSSMQRCLITILTTNWLQQSPQTDPWTLVLEISHRFGACTLASLLFVLARAPSFIIGQRLNRIAEISLVTLTPDSLVAILDPLTLTVAVSQQSSLLAAAQILKEPELMGANRKTYSVAKTFLRATKLTFSLVVAFIAWVHADRIDSAAAVYSYLIAIAAFVTGWTVFGTADNTVGIVLDSFLVNYALSPPNPELQRVFDIY